MSKKNEPVIAEHCQALPPTQEKWQWSAEDYRRAADVHEVAERIIKRVVSNVLSIAHTRAGLSDLADSDPIDEKEFVQDGLQIALGEDTGCLDPDSLSAENCEVLYVEKELREILERGAEAGQALPPQPPKENPTAEQIYKLVRQVPRDQFSKPKVLEMLRRWISVEPAALPPQPEPKWISVKDRLPKETERVLVWFKYHEPDGVKYIPRFGEISCGHWRPEGGNGNFDDNVSHWMPLPEGPGAAAPPQDATSESFHSQGNATCNKVWRVKGDAPQDTPDFSAGSGTIESGDYK